MINRVWRGASHCGSRDPAYLESILVCGACHFLEPIVGEKFFTCPKIGNDKVKPHLEGVRQIRCCASTRVHFSKITRKPLMTTALLNSCAEKPDNTERKPHKKELGTMQQERTSNIVQSQTDGINTRSSEPVYKPKEEPGETWCSFTTSP